MATKGDDRFEVRTGRIRSRGGGRRARSYLSRVARSASKAGPGGGRRRLQSRSRIPGASPRRVIVKTRIVRMTASTAGALAAHLAYIRRDSAMRPEDKGHLFGPETERMDEANFADGVTTDRHHFRFIVSPEDGALMADLKPFVRDLMGQMETDLGTRLDWAAAIHTDTGKPHAHIVLRGRRDDGSDLVIPKRYVSHTMRERAEDLITLELGPETQLELDRKRASEVQAERLTRTDRYLIRSADERGIVSLKKSGRYRQLHAARLKTLSMLGLARRVSGPRWLIDPDMESTLRGLGKRGDIIKTMNRALVGRSDRHMDGASIFDRGNAPGAPVVGAVIASGITGEAHDRVYAILDTLEGRSVYAELGDLSEVEKPVTGSILQLSPPNTKPRQSDHTIAQIAKQNDGVYSAGLHQAADPRASPEFVAAHIRRLEALRRGGLVTRSAKGDWQIAGDHLDRVAGYEQRQAALRPVNAEVLSHLSIDAQVRAVGVTWLDDQGVNEGAAFGFGSDVAVAAAKRRAFLVELGVLASPEETLGTEQRVELRRRDLANTGKALSAEIGKVYVEAPMSGAIEGTYVRAIERPSGKFAVVERAKDFTLVPWRRVMDRSLGKAVLGRVREGRVSWSFGRGRGIGRG